MTSLWGKQTSRPSRSNGCESLIGVALASIRKVTNATTVVAAICCMAAVVGAQKTEQTRQTTVVQDMARMRVLNPQLEFVGQQAYDVNGATGTRFKLSVTNRASFSDSLWQPAANLPPCGENENASRTWVEIFGSPGDKRLYGFCGLRASEDLGQLWFAVPSGKKGPPCVYIVMTDRQTGKKYISNRVCSRIFTVVKGRLKAGGATQEDPDRRQLEVESWSLGPSVQGGFGWDSIGRIGAGNNVANDSGQPTNEIGRALRPDLRIRQFLFPPTNGKSVRVHVINAGQGPAGANRLILTIRKINGVSVGRTTHVNVPALAAGADVWLLIDAKSILPNNVSLASTTFKLNVDGTEIVAESDESNNEVWHNL